jgi:dipeptidyl-peptidase-4
VTVLVSAVPDRPGAQVQVLRDGKRATTVASYAEDPGLSPRVTLVEAGERRVPCAVLLPTGYTEGPLPVLMDPYGGPHGQRVLAAHNPYLTSQWFADQGFAVIVADGRGMPGRSPAWEKSIKDDQAAVVLDDQIHALRALAETLPAGPGPGGDPWLVVRRLSRGARGAAAPDVFHAGVVGAPVTDQRLYDTHYTERYLGDPNTQPEVYAANSLIDDDGLVGAAEPVRPMMIVHGLADDNVVVAHSLRLSSALLAAGRPHEVLPLSGVTHMTPQEQVAENLLLLQVDFLKRSWAATEQVASPLSDAVNGATGRGDMARPGRSTAPARPYVVQTDASVYRYRVSEVACVLTKLMPICHAISRPWARPSPSCPSVSSGILSTGSSRARSIRSSGGTTCFSSAKWHAES